MPSPADRRMAIKLKNGKLEVSVYDPGSPSKKRYGGRFPDTQAGKRAAKKREAQLIEEIQGGRSNSPETIGQFRARWKEDFPHGQRGLRAASTWIVYMEKTKPLAAEFGKRAM